MFFEGIRMQKNPEDTLESSMKAWNCDLPSTFGVKETRYVFVVSSARILSPGCVAGVPSPASWWAYLANLTLRSLKTHRGSAVSAVAGMKFAVDDELRRYPPAAPSKSALYEASLARREDLLASFARGGTTARRNYQTMTCSLLSRLCVGRSDARASHRSPLGNARHRRGCRDALALSVAFSVRVSPSP